MKKEKVFLLLIVIAGIILFSGFRFKKPVENKNKGVDISQGIYVDGKYKGTGTGFRPGMQVEISIQNGKLTNVKILKHNEIGPQYWKRAIDRIPKAIVDKQTTAVDTVGGATYTSLGIKAAVEDALKQAVKK